MSKTQIGIWNSLFIPPFRHLSGPTSSARRGWNFISLMDRGGLELFLVHSLQGEARLLSLPLQHTQLLPWLAQSDIQVNTYR